MYLAVGVCVGYIMINPVHAACVAVLYGHMCISEVIKKLSCCRNTPVSPLHNGDFDKIEHTHTRQVLSTQCSLAGILHPLLLLLSQRVFVRVSGEGGGGSDGGGGGGGAHSWKVVPQLEHFGRLPVGGGVWLRGTLTLKYKHSFVKIKQGLVDSTSTLASLLLSPICLLIEFASQMLVSTSL